jgi:hypothetical protein
LIRILLFAALAAAGAAHARPGRTNRRPRKPRLIPTSLDGKAYAICRGAVVASSRPDHAVQRRIVPVRSAVVLGIVLTVHGELHGAIPAHVRNITPKDGAVNVPTDTVITVEVAGFDVDPAIRLFEAKGGTEVPGKTDKTDGWVRTPPPAPSPPGQVGGNYGSGSTYVFRPRRPLKPRTRYEIRSGLAASRRQGPSSFTTGDGPTRK